jgi:hypothetical protein
LNGVPGPLRPQPSENEAETTKALQQLVDDGAARILSEEEASRTQTWTRTFVRPKTDSTPENPKWRLISDLRPLNACLRTPSFHPETWGTVLELLGQENWTWGLKLDLASFFHHLRLHPRSARWFRMRAGGLKVQAVGLPFGWEASPIWTTTNWCNQFGVG